MIGNVLEINQIGIGDERGISPLQQTDGLPKRPERLAQQNQLSFQQVDGLQFVGSGFFDQVLFQQFNFVVDVFQHGKILINDCVHQMMRQIIRPCLADSSLVGADPFTNGVKQRSRFFLKGQNEIRPQKNADLLRVQVLTGGMMDVL
ncbi:MAG: hypothetical protein BWX45_00569 [Deltaproteobacteria bacterium ADurb.Bin002]|nr:MAG: hypothetical protein BWX45_00569 [Deltaproteobacteria bacterium ADurb.Bin002]